VLDAYHELHPDRRAEIDRHLGIMLPGAMQDRRDADLADEIRRRRIGSDRRSRVPLFFEPDPEPPRLLPAKPPQITGKNWGYFVFGVAAVIAGEMISVRAAASVRLPATLLAVAVWVAGTAIAVTVGLPFQYPMWRRIARERERTGTGVPVAAPGPMISPPERAAMQDFADALDRLLDRHFGDALADGADPVEAAARKATLRQEILEGYFSPSFRVNRLAWLIRWHARQIVALSQADAADELHAAAPQARDGMLRLAASVAASSCGAALGLILAAQASLSTAFLVALFIVVGLYYAAANGLWIYNEQRRHADDRTTLLRRHQQELDAFEQEQERFQARPDDREMARWLDYDKDYIRTRAMRQYELKSTDVVSHSVLTEPAPHCQQARQPGGPPRYSKYRVRLFLLTPNGIRMVEEELDFASGALNKQRRVVFRYDAIASLDVQPRDVRPRGRRQIAAPDGGGPVNQLPRPILRHACSIRLMNGPDIEIKTDFDDLLPREHREDPEAIQQLIDDTTGAVKTLELLESVAAEGDNWIRRQRDRIRERLSEYQRFADEPPEPAGAG
jgi:hypothetical protein